MNNTSSTEVSISAGDFKVLKKEPRHPYLVAHIGQSGILITQAICPIASSSVLEVVTLKQLLGTNGSTLKHAHGKWK